MGSQTGLGDKPQQRRKMGWFQVLFYLKGAFLGSQSIPTNCNHAYGTHLMGKAVFASPPCCWDPEVVAPSVAGTW